MPCSLFHSRFLDVADRETRTVIVIDSSDFNLPPAHYSFLEMFCDEPGCDCCRVFFSVVSSLQKDIQAVIAWGWEEREFYTKWMGDDDPRIINDFIVDDFGSGVEYKSANPFSQKTDSVSNQ